MLNKSAKEVVCAFLYSKIEASGAVDKDGNVQEQFIVELDDEHQITVEEAYQLISILEA